MATFGIPVELIRRNVVTPLVILQQLVYYPARRHFNINARGVWSGIDLEKRVGGTRMGSSNERFNGRPPGIANRRVDLLFLIVEFFG